MKYIFKHEGYKTNIELSFDEMFDPHIGEFVEMCKRFALALGYAESTVDKWFGKPSEEIDIDF